jgi:TolB-like protein/DNA-binding winged helix-turn-helix (wHTH) protein
VPSASSPIRFGVFELDVRTGELRKSGLRIRLASQPLVVLTLLLEHPGEVVTREQLRQQLWSAHTFVDFEKGLNAAVKRLREALGDSAANPHFIETLPRHGYRFIAQNEGVEHMAEAGAPETARTPLRTKWLVRTAWMAVLVVSLLLVAKTSDFFPRQRLVSGPAPIHSLAVLPLVNLSNDPAQEYFSEGMTEALIAELGRVRSLRVISRQSAMHFKGTTETVPQIAKELKVDALVEGSALLDGNRVRISVQLIRVNPEEHIWSESYDRELSDILSLQRDVGRAIAGEIRTNVSSEDQTGPTTTRKVDPAAHVAYLRGRYFVNRWPAIDFHKCAAYLNEATERDPDYAEAYAALGICYWMMVWSQPPKAIFPKVEAATLKSLQIDASVAEAHVALGAARMFFDWDWLGAERELKLAADLNPSNPFAHVLCSNHFLFLGRFDEAVAEARKAVQLDPASLLTNRGLTFVYLMARRYDEAIAQSRVTLELDPANTQAQIDVALAYALKGEMAQARAEANRFGFGDHPFFALPEKRKETLERIDRDVRRRATGSEEYVDAFYIAMQYCSLGDREQAFKWLGKAYEDRSAMMVQLKVNPVLDSLRSDPRFQDLLRRTNFPS